ISIEHHATQPAGTLSPPGGVPSTMLRAAALALVLLSPCVLASGFAGEGAALSSLRASQASDGGWGSRTATDWVLLGLAAAKEDPRRGAWKAISSRTRPT